MTTRATKHLCAGLTSDSLNSVCSRRDQWATAAPNEDRTGSGCNRDPKAEGACRSTTGTFV
jgi:hypothetical protein